MRYRTRDGVVLETICGQHRLIATLEARKHCPIVSALNDSSVFVWKMMEEGLDDMEMEDRVLQEYPDIDRTAARKVLDTFVSSLQKEGYIIPEH